MEKFSESGHEEKLSKKYFIFAMEVSEWRKREGFDILKINL